MFNSHLVLFYEGNVNLKVNCYRSSRFFPNTYIGFSNLLPNLKFIWKEAKLKLKKLFFSVKSCKRMKKRWNMFEDLRAMCSHSTLLCLNLRRANM